MSSVPIVTSSSVVIVVDLADITTVARGAKPIAQTKNPISNITNPPIITNFLRNRLKFGILPPLPFLSLVLDFLSAGFLELFSAISSLTAAEPKLSGLSAVFCNSPIGRFLPSIISSSLSTFSAGISANSGLLCKFFATGIFAEAANPDSA